MQPRLPLEALIIFRVRNVIFKQATQVYWNYVYFILFYKWIKYVRYPKYILQQNIIFVLSSHVSVKLMDA